MTTKKKIRRAVLTSLLAGSTILSTGCANGRGFSLASLNPFSSPTASRQSKSDGTTAIAKSKEMLDRSKDAVTGAFAEKRESKRKSVQDVDPLRLDNKTKVGPEVFVANGRLWESTGNNQKAMESYTRALEAKANDPGALASIARLHFKEGKNQQAIEFFERAVQQKSDDPSLYNDLGLTFSKVGNHSSASMMLERALELSPGVSRYANNLASIKFKAGDASGAYKVLASNNKPAVAHYNMAYLHHKSGQMKDARSQLLAALKFSPQAKADSSIARAVESSRTLLTQIDGPDAIANLNKKAADVQQVAQRTPAPPTETITKQASSRSTGVPVRTATMRTKADSSQSMARLASAKLGSKTPIVSSQKTADAIAAAKAALNAKPKFELPTPTASQEAARGPYELPADFDLYSK